MMTDERILSGMKDGDTEALEQMICKYHGLVNKIIFNILRDSGDFGDVEELTQDTFYAVWNYAENISPGRLRSYLSSTARNTAKSFLRKNREIPMDLDYVEIPDSTLLPEESIIERELSRRLKKAIGRMKPKEREVFLRYYYYFEPTSEIAERMGIPDATVRSHLLRGRKKLQKMLSKEGWI